MTAERTFEIIAEVEPATRPDLTRVRRQIGVMGTVADAYLIPDNHIGRATVSSIAVAHEVAQMGGRAIACLNARDRNLLGFRRDLLTAAAYGVDEFLFVYGDRPESGSRSDDITVATMIDEARRSPADAPVRIGVASRLGALPAWKRAADSLFVQVGWSVDALAEWRSSIDFAGRVVAGVMVVPSASMARKLGADVPQLAVPDDVIAAVERDPSAGVTIACDLIDQIEATGLFDGAHLVPTSRYREVAAELETRRRRAR